jgi:hypothetical protein
MFRLRLVFAVSITLVAFAALADPPARVARLNYIDGAVSFRPAGLDDWAPASVNRVLIGSDELWTDQGSRAELHFGSSSIRLGEQTDVGFLNLDDDGLQLRLTAGTLNLRIRRLGPDETVEIDTPNTSLTLWRPGSYRVNVSPDGDRTFVVVHDGELEATVPGSTFSVRPHEVATIVGNGDDIRNSVAAVGPNDSFDRWCSDRDHRDDVAFVSTHVPRELVGYEDLAEYGSWESVPAYGWVWAPRAVAVGWAPYHNGHWAWIEPWGWTWVDDAPWGFAPFHYGRWAHYGDRWVWAPGEVVRPVYAPALVAWVGGNHWGASISFGGGGGVGWFPLAPREVYRPAYRVAPGYLREINRGAPVTNININVNVTNIHYANQAVPGAMTAVPREGFATARPVSQIAVRIPKEAVLSAQVSGPAAPVAPRPQSVIGHPNIATNIVRPPEGFRARAVVARVAPPAPVAPFAARTALLDKHPGTPLAAEEIRTVHAASPQVMPAVKPAVKTGFIPRSEARQHAAAAAPQTPIHPVNGGPTPTPGTAITSTPKLPQPAVVQPRTEEFRRPPVKPAVTATTPVPVPQPAVAQPHTEEFRHPPVKPAVTTTTSVPQPVVVQPRTEEFRRPPVKPAVVKPEEKAPVTATAPPPQPTPQPAAEQSRRQVVKPEVVKPEVVKPEVKKVDDKKKDDKKTDKKDDKKKDDEKKKDQ